MSIKLFRVLSKIRLLQLYRLLKEIGVVRIIFLLFLTIHSFIIIYKLVLSAPLICFVATIFLLLLLDRKRKDKFFLDMLFSRSSKYIIIFEYIILSLPSFVLLLIGEKFLYSLLLMGIIFIIPYLNIRIMSKRLLFNMDFLPKTAFEWKSGFRLSLLFSIPLIIVGTIWADRTFIPVIVVFLLTIIWSSYNMYCESRLMVEVFRWNAIKYLMHKISRQMFFSFCLMLPVNILFLYWNSHYWTILLYINFISYVVQSLSICFKYAMFIPGRNLRFNILLLCSATGLFFFPWTSPIPLVILIIYYIKAIKNLKRYLYVGN